MSSIHSSGVRAASAAWLSPYARRALTTAIVLSFLVIPVVVPPLVPAVAAVPAGSRIPWQGSSWYLHGANVPWFNWGCDFGCNASGGVSSTSATLGSRFGGAQAAGLHTIRWWVFPGDPWQITRDSAGVPTGINSAVYADFDAALSLASQYDLYFDFVLFSNPSGLPAAWLNDARQRQRLADALGQLFARYRDNPRILSWEVFNEPDFDVWGGRVSQSSLSETVRAVAASVHANSTAYVTVGMGLIDGLPMVQGTGLDYYQAHWYDYMSSGTYCARCRTYADVRSQFGLDAPLVIGELYAGSDVDSYQRYKDFYDKGYAGAWPWSLFPEKTNDRLAVDLAAAQTFSGQHADLGPRGDSPPPRATSTPTPTSLPLTSTPTPTSLPLTSTPTPTPTLTPDDPTPTPTSRPSQGAGFTSGGTARPSVVAPGSADRFRVSVTSRTEQRALIDVEVYGPTGDKVFQRFYDNQAFAAGQTRTYSPTWRVPPDAPSGTYTLMIGAFSTGWGTLYHWNHEAAQFTVQ